MVWGERVATVLLQLESPSLRASATKVSLQVLAETIEGSFCQCGRFVKTLSKKISVFALLYLCTCVPFSRGRVRGGGDG